MIRLLLAAALALSGCSPYIVIATNSSVVFNSAKPAGTATYTASKTDSSLKTATAADSVK